MTFALTPCAVTPAGYHAWRRRGPTAHHTKDAEIPVVDLVMGSILWKGDGTYADPRMHDELKDMRIPGAPQACRAADAPGGLVSRPKPASW